MKIGHRDWFTAYQIPRSKGEDEGQGEAQQDGPPGQIVFQNVTGIHLDGCSTATTALTRQVDWLDG